jgi:hypothetical protein
MMGTDVGKAKGVTMRSIVPVESIVSRILVFREEKVLIDRDLAERYEVSTKVLNQAVKRNMRRFPRDFMFQLMKNEKNELVTNCDRFKTLKHSSVLPKAFTEQGVAMLSSVLNSDRAVEVNIAIMKAFVHLRRMVSSHADLARRITELEERMEDHDEQIKAIFEAMRQLMTPPDRPKKKIGFEVKEPKAMYGKRRG